MRKIKSNMFFLFVGLGVMLLTFSGCPDKSPSFSAKSKEVADLLDKENYEAAKILLKSYIPQSPNDSGLYCQYVRLLVSAYDIKNDYELSTPLFPPDGKDTTTRIIKEAARIAVQLEPKNKEWIAETILNGLHSQTKEMAEKGDGIISYTSPGLIKAAWTAIEIEPETSKNWANKYKDLIPAFAKSGKAVSTMYLGNLAGDLLAGKENSEQAFQEATKAFKLAVESENSNEKIIQDTWFLYTNLFRTSCEQAVQNRTSEYFGLLQIIKAKEYKLNYSDWQLRNDTCLPVDFRPTPTPSPTPFLVVTPTPLAILTPTPSPTPTKIYLYVTSENLNLRSEPNLTNEPILKIENGARLYLLPPTDCRTCAKDGKWFRVHHVSSGKEGWISNEFRGEKTFEFDF